MRNLTTIVVAKDGLDYIVPATEPTRREKIAKMIDKAGEVIDRLFFTSDLGPINSVKASPRKGMH